VVVVDVGAGCNADDVGAEAMNLEEGVVVVYPSSCLVDEIGVVEERDSSFEIAVGHCRFVEDLRRVWQYIVRVVGRIAVQTKWVVQAYFAKKDDHLPPCHLKQHPCDPV
jgi:hypothetical protein